MEGELSCPLCAEMYSAGDGEPVLLPHCGHVFCRICLRSVCGNSASFRCPTCRKPHHGVNVQTLPTVFVLLSLSENYKPSDEGVCDHHGSTLEFWCRNCSQGLCGQCLLRAHIKDNHEVIKAKEFIAAKKHEMFSTGLQILQEIDIVKDVISENVFDHINGMVRDSFKSSELHSLTQKTKKSIDDLELLVSVDSVSVMSTKFESLLSELHKLQDIEKTEVKKESSSEVASNVTSPIHTEESLDDLVYQDIAEESNDMNKEDTLLEAAALEVSNTNKGLISKKKLLRPFRLCVVDGTGRNGYLRMENSRLHVYALSQDHCEVSHVQVQLCVFMARLTELPEVFLDLKAKDRQLGRVYLQLDGRLRRSQHFLALCIGSMGPSYRGSRFHGVVKKGAPGETLAGGRYIIPEGDSVQGLMKDLEWGGDNIKVKKEGLLVGASGGKPELDAFFHICTIGHPERKFACAFGEVLEGMDVVKEAVAHEPVTDVFIMNAGIIVP